MDPKQRGSNPKSAVSLFVDSLISRYGVGAKYGIYETKYLSFFCVIIMKTFFRYSGVSFRRCDICDHKRNKHESVFLVTILSIFLFSEISSFFETTRFSVFVIIVSLNFSYTSIPEYICCLLSRFCLRSVCELRFDYDKLCKAYDLDPRTAYENTVMKHVRNCGDIPESLLIQERECPQIAVRFDGIHLFPCMDRCVCMYSFS